MRRVETTRRSRFYYLATVLLDDIETLCGAGEKAHFTVLFSDDTHEFDSVEDVIEHKGENVRDLSMVFRHGSTGDSLCVLFSPGISAVSAYGSSIEVKALWTEIDAVLAKRRRRLGILWLRSFWGGLAGGSFCGAIIVGIASRSFNLWDFAFPMLAFLGFALSLYSRACSAALFLDREHRKSTFWTRNGDKIIVLVIGALIGVLGKLLYDVLVK